MEGNKFDGPWDEPIVNEPPIVLQYWSAKRSANFGIFCWSVAYCFPKHLWLNPDFAAYHLSLDMWYYIYIQWYTYIEIVIKYRSEILKCYLSSWCLGTGTMEVIFLLYRIFPRSICSNPLDVEISEYSWFWTRPSISVYWNCSDLDVRVPWGNLTWMWKPHHVKNMFFINHVFSRSNYVSLPQGI